jgi:hypothetical protein
MQDLAIIVSLMLATELLISLAVVYFAAVYRFRGKFKRTAMTLTTLLAILAGWLMGMEWRIGLPATVAVIVSILFMYVPSLRKKK